MFLFSIFSSVKKILSKSEKKDKNCTLTENPFPRFRASVDESLGKLDDGTFEYYCNNCFKIIKDHRHHFLECDNYDLCEKCLIDNIDKCSNYKIKTTLYNEDLAELKEINYIYEKINKDYYGNNQSIINDFNNFLLFCNLKKYQEFNNVCVKDWLRTFNSYTLNLFTLSNQYKKSAFKQYNTFLFKSSSIY